MKCVEVYKELYHQEPFDVAFCPYRISPLGAHIDHQYGKINGLAIDKGIHMAYHPKQNGVVELQSLNFPKRAQFFVSAVPEEKQGDWADHLRGAAKMLGEKYRLKVGLSGIIEGSLPIGGLSSSASVIICFLSALCKVNGIHLEPMEMILTAKAAENQYVGVSCGKLDQSCEVLSKLVGDAIPLSAQIVSLADVYDALTSERCYKKAYSHDKAVEMILNGECGVFNPKLVECFVEIQNVLREELCNVKYRDEQK